MFVVFVFSFFPLVYWLLILSVLKVENRVFLSSWIKRQSLSGHHGSFTMAENHNLDRFVKKALVDPWEIGQGTVSCGRQQRLWLFHNDPQEAQKNTRASLGKNAIVWLNKMRQSTQRWLASFRDSQCTWGLFLHGFVTRTYRHAAEYTSAVCWPSSR